MCKMLWSNASCKGLLTEWDNNEVDGSNDGFFEDLSRLQML